MQKLDSPDRRPARPLRLRLVFVAAAGLALLAGGCARHIHLQEPYLQRVGPAGATRLQVYTAGDIELVRLVGSRDDVTVSDTHRLRFEKGEYVEKIHLRSSTPGAIVSFRSTEELVVSFEPPDENGDERTLTFRRVDGTDPRVYWLWDGDRDRFVCNVEKFREWRTPPTYLKPCSTAVTYGGQRYEVDLRYGQLDIKEETVDDSRTDRRTVQGRPLP